MRNLLFMVFAMSGIAAMAAGQASVFINVDNDKFFYGPPESMTEEGLLKRVDDVLKEGGVTDYVFCPCGQRASFDSKAWEPIWCGIDEPCDNNGRIDNEWAGNCKLLRDRGIDPYKVWSKRVRGKGKNFWLSVRMNDLHFWSITNYFRITSFWKKRPELHIDRGLTRDSERQGLDFSLKEVRDYTFSMIGELLARYDMDGIELDWTRFPFYFEPGTEMANSIHLTEIMRKTRAAANRAEKRLGHQVRIAVRIAAEPEAAIGLGTDFMTWAKEGLVDVVVPCNFYHAANYALPYGEWKRQIGTVAPSVKIYPGVDICVGCAPGQSRSTNLARFAGWIELMREAGAEGFYVFNAPYFADDMRIPLYRGDFATSKIVSFPRATLPEFLDYSIPRGYPNKAQLPQTTKWDRFVEINAVKPRDGERVAVAVAFDEKGFPPEIVTLNGVRPNGAARKIDAAGFRGTVLKLKKETECAFEWEFPADALRTGMNSVRIGRTLPIRNITWCEIRKTPAKGKGR
jgi:hypothetical protein